MSMEKDLNIVLAGFGGQGILFAGKVLAYAGLQEGKEISWLPSTVPKCAAARPIAACVFPTKPLVLLWW